MDAIQYGVNYHSNKTSLAKLFHGTVESSLTATSTQLWPPLCNSHFFCSEDSPSGESRHSEKGEWGGGAVSKNNFLGPLGLQFGLKIMAWAPSLDPPLSPYMY